MIIIVWKNLFDAIPQIIIATVLSIFVYIFYFKLFTKSLDILNTGKKQLLKALKFKKDVMLSIKIKFDGIIKPIKLVYEPYLMLSTMFLWTVMLILLLPYNMAVKFYPQFNNYVNIALIIAIAILSFTSLLIIILLFKQKSHTLLLYLFISLITGTYLLMYLPSIRAIWDPPYSIRFVELYVPILGIFSFVLLFIYKLRIKKIKHWLYYSFFSLLISSAIMNTIISYNLAVFIIQHMGH
ncbi:MAG: hypothetical protein ACP5MW_00555 [Thermoplasmata archaeon]